MQVHTFSTGGCTDGIYLESLSLTKEGVSNLIDTHFDREYIDRDFQKAVVKGDRIIVSYIDTDTKEVETESYRLISFDVY